MIYPHSTLTAMAAYRPLQTGMLKILLDCTFQQPKAHIRKGAFDRMGRKHRHSKLQQICCDIVTHILIRWRPQKTESYKLRNIFLQQLENKAMA